MRYLLKNRLWGGALLLIILILSASCDDRWNEHYDQATENYPDYNLFEYINTTPELERFAEILKTTGFDSIIGESQTYTVWAPDNDALEGIDMQDSEQLDNIVKNHIARGNITTSFVLINYVRMMNGKYLKLLRLNDDSFTFSDVKINNGNIRTANGIVHIIDEHAPYINNIWEYISNSNDMDSLKNYLFGLNQYIFDAENSTEIGIDTLGNPEYDSLFVQKNLFFEKLGHIDDEDSTFTMILPDDNAWNIAYEKIRPYFNFPDVYGGESRREKTTRWTIVKDLVFKERILEPASLERVKSSSGNYFYNPSHLFSNSTQLELSNGVVYETSQLQHRDTASWYKEIRVEAENPEGRDNANNRINTLSGRGTGLDISDNSYIRLLPTGSSDFVRSNVTFTIPNTLSAKYRIYCVFVPANLTDTADMRPTRADFQLTYMSTTTGRTRRQRISPEIDETDPVNGITKMFVTEFDFEFANVVEQDFSEVPVSLQVTNSVKVSEEDEYTQQMAIDCIIFEPVFDEE